MVYMTWRGMSRSGVGIRRALSVRFEAGAGVPTRTGCDAVVSAGPGQVTRTTTAAFVPFAVKCQRGSRSGDRLHRARHRQERVGHHRRATRLEFPEDSAPSKKQWADLLKGKSILILLDELAFYLVHASTKGAMRHTMAKHGTSSDRIPHAKKSSAQNRGHPMRKDFRYSLQSHGCQCLAKMVGLAGFEPTTPTPPV